MEAAIDEAVTKRPQRSLRPRQRDVAFSLPRLGAFLVCLLVVGACALSFGAGFLLGHRTDSPKEAQPMLRGTKSVTIPDKPEVRRPPSPLNKNVVPIAPELPPPVQIRRSAPAGRMGIQIGAFVEYQDAVDFVERHAPPLSKLDVFVVTSKVPGKGVWHRVRIGAFVSAAEAERVKSALPDELSRSSIVVSYR